MLGVFSCPARLLSRLALVLLATLCGAATAAAQTFQFGPPVPLNPNAMTDTDRDLSPRVETDGAGTWVAVWESHVAPPTGGYLEGDILVSRSTDNGVTWSAPAPIHPALGLDDRHDMQPRLAVDGAGNWVVAWTSYVVVGTEAVDANLWMARSSDGGATWTVPGPLNNDAATDPYFDFPPEIVTDRAGTWVVVWERQDDLYTARSTDAGATWSSPVVVDPIADVDHRSDDSPELATDGSTWVLVCNGWSPFNGPFGRDRDVFVARSVDGGVTWSALAPLNPTALTDADEDTRPDVTTDGAGSWVAVWSVHPPQNVPGDADVVVARSTDGGLTWTALAPLNTNAAVDSGLDGNPTVTTDGSTWIAAWNSKDTLGGTLPSGPLASGNTNILQARSTNGGVTWTAPAALNTDAYFDDCRLRSYIDPQLVSDGAGTWLASWWGMARECPGWTGDDFDIFMARATTACGNNVVDAGEDCDDGGLVAGDGCDPSCHDERAPSVCGNGVHEIGEQCDDGNGDPGDGCDATCRFDPPFVCGNGLVEISEECDDGNLVGFDGCDPTCRIENPLLTCGNGAIDPGEECDDGNHDSGDGCDFICRLESWGACRPTPDAACRGALGRLASLKIKRNALDPSKDRLDWKWRGVDATSKEDFGDPSSADDYYLCVYDAGQLVSTTHVHGGMCGTKPCWKSTSKGYAFKDSSLAQDGAAKLDLVAGAAGKPQLRFAGRGMNLQTPSLPAAGQVEVQLRRGTGPLCWGATYQGPFSRNDGTGFTARSN